MPLKTLFTKRYMATTLLVLAAMAVMIRLGVWQLDRRQQRIARNADFVAKLEQAPQSLNEAAAAPVWPFPQDRTEIRNIRASATGQFDYSQQILLTQQNLDNRPGAHLVAPLLLEGSDRAVLVDRGWIPLEEANAGDWSRFDDQVGRVTINGFLQPPQILYGKAAEQAAAAGNTEPVKRKSQWYRLDIQAIQAQVPYELLPVYLLQSPPPEGNVAYPTRVEPEFDLSEGPHMSYALQWFSFALIAGVIYLRIVYRNTARLKDNTQNRQNGSEATRSLQKAYDAQQN